MAKKIPLTRGLFAIVDDADFKWLSRWKWYAQKRPSQKTQAWLACRCVRTSRPKRRKTIIFMHQVIFGRVHGYIPDHVNGDTLDNRRRNLRQATQQQNVWNARHPRGRSGFIGVSYHASRPSACKWRATIAEAGRNIHLGWFAKAPVAARARDVAAVVMRGEFAVLNFPKADYR